MTYYYYFTFIITILNYNIYNIATSIIMIDTTFTMLSVTTFNIINLYYL